MTDNRLAIDRLIDEAPAAQKRRLAAYRREIQRVAEECARIARDRDCDCGGSCVFCIAGNNRAKAIEREFRLEKKG